MPKPRTITNPINKEVVTFLKTGEETQGEYMLARMELAPGGGVPLHLQTTFNEKIKILKGPLHTRLNGQTRVLEAGDEITFGKNEPHRFWSEADDTVVFEFEIRPARTFEEAIRIGDGLAEDGKANKQGLPKSLLHQAVVQRLIESYLAFIPVWLQKAVFSPFYQLAKVTGTEKKLKERYLQD